MSVAHADSPLKLPVAAGLAQLVFKETEQVVANPVSRKFRISPAACACPAASTAADDILQVTLSDPQPQRRALLEEIGMYGESDLAQVEYPPMLRSILHSLSAACDS